MIFHTRKPSLRAHAYELLARHIPDHLPAKHEILKDADLMRAGEFGEQRIDQLLSPFASDKFLIGHNLLLPYEGETIQIDHLILTPAFALTIETKHYKGHMKLDLENEQMYRLETDGSIFTTTHPSLQVERHRAGLKHLFTQINTDLPIYSLIPFTHPGVHLEAVGSSNLLPKNIFRADRFTMKLREILAANDKEQYDLSALRKISNGLASSTVNEKIYNVLNKHNIATDILESGVWCNACMSLTVKWIARRFRCELCGLQNDESYLDSLFVYLTFINPTISNREARVFLNVNSPATMWALLQRANLLAKYKTSKRRYCLRKPYRAD
ncbi:hypothetical protein JMA_05850 [Jeotgalibacillus malaysiensis]|uniref:NERD domain-containing protein n=1 Tax=Jeotgalibacillus malaysiensis TaxID=1508404 RepID=A0A0B5AMM1_9BACL|nr:nuclease-related domain-containing protein [Jeotgalibacillus malaysiensis]AJD89902.1 hypothetical protein JMA_05850 [Jeotgalibacillus malaysiensis]